MRIVVVSKDLQGMRQVDLTSPFSLSCMAIFILVLITAGFGFGYRTSETSAIGADLTAVIELREQLELSRLEIETTRRNAEDTVDALAIRLGQMNAHVIRLDALGRRLTEMAELEDGEFDFAAPPAIGGPEEPDPIEDGEVASIGQSLDGLALQLADREKQLGVLESMLLSRDLTARTYPRGRPVMSGWLSSYYGKRTDPFTGKQAWHKGVDFAGKAGAEIIAVAAGVVTYSGARYGYGNMVELDHGKGYVTRYAHHHENLVAVGGEVGKGQVIAHMGATGRATGPNLHFEVLHGGKSVDPVKFIKAGGTNN